MLRDSLASQSSRCNYTYDRDINSPFIRYYFLERCDRESMGLR